MRRFFNRSMAESQSTGHVAITLGSGKTRQFPVVKGIVQIPDDLAHSIVGSAWEPYTGQIPLPEGYESGLAEINGEPEGLAGGPKGGRRR